MPNLLKELEIIEGKESYLVQVYDEGTAGKVGTLADLQTTDKSNLVGAVNEVNSKADNNASNITTLQNDVERIDGDIDNIEGSISTINGSITSITGDITGIKNNIGTLSNLNTTDKTSLVNAINEVVNDVEHIETNYLHYVYVESYLLDGQTDTNALKNAIADCPSKGCVVLPNRELTITETIVINKPMKLMGLRNGFFQLEGGNNYTPNADYVTYDLNMSGLSTCFSIASPSVELCDINIKINDSTDCKVFELTSAQGDNLNMPRDIRMKNIEVINTAYHNPSHTIYGVYSVQPVLLSRFDHVTFGWVSYAFYFNANINTSLSFIDCGCTVSEVGYYLQNATYCEFIKCGCESQAPCGFRFDGCKSITLLNCYCEQITVADFVAVNCRPINFIGCFATSGVLINTSLCNGSIIGCCCSYDSTALLPWLSLYGSYMKLVGMGDCFITVDNGTSTRRIGYSDCVTKFESTDFTGFTPSGFSILSGRWNLMDSKIQITLEISASATSGTLTMPAYMLPVKTSVVPLNPSGWATLAYQSNVITFNFGTTGTFTVMVEFDSIAVQ